MAITYTPTTNFGSKDSLPANDPAKVIKGAEFTTEFTAIQSAFSLAAPSSNPTFTGTATFADLTVLNGLTVDGDTLVVDDVNNRVGIGTASPAVDLDVSGGSNTQIRLTASDSLGSSIVNFGDQSNAAVGRIVYSHVTDSFSFKTNNSNDRMVIDSSGNVGIGTATPTQRVTIENKTQTTPDYVSFNTIATNYTADEWGGFLIESSDPSGGGAGVKGSIRAVNESNIGGRVGWEFSIADGVSNDLLAMKIDSFGNVGIGAAPTASSSYRTLNIVGGADVGGAIRLSTTEGENAHMFNFNDVGYFGGDDVTILSTGDPAVSSKTGYRIDATGLQRWYDPTDGTTERMRISASGNLGVGDTNPTEKLSVITEDGGQIKLTSPVAAAGSVYFAANDRARFGYSAGFVSIDDRNSFGTSTTKDLAVNLGGSERMRITSGGKVGIGTADPSSGYGAKLVVTDGAVGGSTYIDIANNNDNQFLKLGINNNDGVIAVDDGDALTFGHLTNASTTTLTERMRIDSSGNVRLTTANDTAGTSKSLQFGSTAFNRAEIRCTNAATFDGSLEFYTGNSSNFVERMRIDASGNVLVGTTTLPGAAADSGVSFSDVNGTIGQINVAKTFSGSTAAANFWYNTTKVGSISYTDTSTAYNTSSDVRLKENIVDAPAGNIDALQVRSFDWKADGERQTYGFIAQELEEAAPYAVTKGETEDDMWAVDYSKLVPMLVKEIQDLKAKVEALENA